MAALPYMQLYVADYLADTAYLDVIESGAYLHLLMNYWQTGKPLPDDDKKLARISKCTEEQWLNVRSTVVDYFVEQDGVLHHNRVEQDLRAVSEKQTKASLAGKASAEARKKKKNTPKTNAEPTNVEQAFNERLTDSEQTLNHTETDTDTDTEIKTVAKNPKPKAKPKTLAERYPAPVDVAPKQWLDYLEARKYKKRPMTTGSLELFVSAFEATKAETGIKAKDLIECATIGGWQTIKADYVTEQPSRQAFTPNTGECDRFSRLATMAENTPSTETIESLEGELA